MKKGLLFLATTALLVACNEEKKTLPPDYVIFSGKIENITSKEFNLRGSYTSEMIEVNDDGTFLDTLNISHEGVYFIGNQRVYFQKGKNVAINLDLKNPKNTTFSGDLVAENTYFVKRSNVLNEIIGENVRDFYALEESAFLQKLDEIVQKTTALTNESTFSDNNFKEMALRDINYVKNYYISVYENYHRAVTKNPEFQVSENFPTFELKDKDNAEDFNFSGAYKNLVYKAFEEKIEEIYTDSTTTKDVVKAVVDELKNYKSDNVKTYLVNGSLVDLMGPGNDDLDFIYNQILANVTDEKFKADVTEKYNKMKALTKGSPSPKFEFENYKGGKTSLDDFKGKYVYIDVWATWCGPCLREIPHLQEIEKKYHGKNIEFVGISIDNKKDYEKWRTFIADKKLAGTQLFADNAWETPFVQEYAINGIPRFILVDTEGNIVSADAPRPSDKKLIELFAELGI